MKKTLFISFILLTVNTNAQLNNNVIRVEVIDMTEIELLSAQYRLMQNEIRAKQEAKNHMTALDNNMRIHTFLYSDLMKLAKKTENKEKHIKTINKLIDKNERLYKRYNSNRYNDKLSELEHLINLEYNSIISEINK